jgi:hypothetical protein
MVHWKILLFRGTFRDDGSKETPSKHNVNIIAYSESNIWISDVTGGSMRIAAES